jgi:hypothetical protein
MYFPALIWAFRLSAAEFKAKLCFPLCFTGASSDTLIDDSAGAIVGMGVELALC